MKQCMVIKFFLMESIKQSVIQNRIIIDIELVFDFWSLLFCAARHVISNKYHGVTLSNKDYSHIVNKPINVAVRALQASHGLSDEDVQNILSTFESHLSSIKPWIPYQQLISTLTKQSKYQVSYTTLIEENYIQLLPFLKSHEIVDSPGENDILITSRDIISSSRIVSVKPRNFDIV